MGTIDTAINVELQKHVLHPGGTIDVMRVWCDACRKALHPAEVTQHLNEVAMTALTKGSK